VGLGGEASLKMPIDLRARVRDIKRKPTSQDTPPPFFRAGLPSRRLLLTLWFLRSDNQPR